jgi:hypothetical protein
MPQKTLKTAFPLSPPRFWGQEGSKELLKRFPGLSENQSQVEKIGGMPVSDAFHDKNTIAKSLTDEELSEFLGKLCRAAARQAHIGGHQGDGR